MSAPTQLRRPAAARSAAVALAAAAALCAAPATATATATTLEGAAQVVDGDTLRLGAAPVRLEGLDAPERDQTCQDARGHAYPCGEAAAEALRRLIRGRDVRCEIRGADVYGRSLAVCTAAGRDLARDMVLAGWARAGDKLADRYAAQEAAARTARRGLWAGRFQDPWDWRASRRGREGRARRRLRPQRQYQRKRPPLPRPRPALVRPDAHRRRRGRALVLLPARGPGGRLAPRQALSAPPRGDGPSPRPFGRVSAPP
ncbi:MAG: thermonuclease family protein [Pseudomonadota bacterium]